jgi:hypothetical protein
MEDRSWKVEERGTFNLKNAWFEEEAAQSR